MLDRIMNEATELEYKETVEVRKPKSWLKTVSAFANGIGGIILFGITDDHEIIGVDDIQKRSETITALIRQRISPVPAYVMKTIEEDGKMILILSVQSGSATPYYYRYDGIREAYIRLGNESIAAPDHILNELILKGSNQTFDGMVTQFRRKDFSFTKLEATYRTQTGMSMEERDYISFGLKTTEGYLTNAALLLADQSAVYTSRVFCTRWNGTNKGSLFEDAWDSKEYSGNLLYLLEMTMSFIDVNNRSGFKKSEYGRIEFSNYAMRAVKEALVNALIHRDYYRADSEIHVDIYDDRMEIVSPGGVYRQIHMKHIDVTQLESYRRNPILADLFHRLRFMERRGSGISKIIAETRRLYGYTDEKCPVFQVDDQRFKVIFPKVEASFDAEESNGFKNILYQMQLDMIAGYCVVPRTREELHHLLDHLSRNAFLRRYLHPLLKEGRLRRTIPDKPSSPYQKYIASNVTRNSKL